MVFVLPDEQLKGDGKTYVSALLGLPALYAFDRVAWLEGGQALALGEAAPAVGPAAQPIFWHAEGVGIPLSTTKGTRGAHLDTGANKTDLYLSGLALLSEEEIRSAKPRMIRSGAAGGTVERMQRELPRVGLALGNSTVELQGVTIKEESPGEGAGRVGMDFVAQLETLVLDFEHMLLDARLKDR